MNSVNSLKRPLDNDSSVSLSKIACCSTSGAQTQKKVSKVQKYSDLVKDTNDGLKVFLAGFSQFCFYLLIVL